MKECNSLISKLKKTELLCKPRQAYNIIEADNMGCGIITVTPELIAKLLISIKISEL